MTSASPTPAGVTIPHIPSNTPQHLRLESLGFSPDDSMQSFTHSAVPCPLHHSSGHALFGRWNEGMVYPELFDQKTAEKVVYSEVFQLSDLELGVDLPATAQDPDGDDPASDSPAAWTVVSSIAELKELPRFIVVRDKRPLTGPSKDGTEMEASTFSHRRKDDSKCGSFEGDIDAETFVRSGGVCIDHVSVSRRWDSKEKRYRRVKRTTPRYRSGGWFSHTAWQEALPAGEGLAVSFCTGYSDAPAIVILDLDYPKAPKGETLDPLKAEGADLTRDTLIQMLSSFGCPYAPSASGNGRRVAFSVHVQDADYYERKHAIWRHPSGVILEVYPPGAQRHVMLYGLDGDLPELAPAAIDDVLTAQDFTKATPSDTDRHTIWGSKGLASFMEVCDRESWDLAFNEMSGTAFCNGVEQDDDWIHRTRSHLELNYLLATEKTTPSGGAYVLTSRFNVNEKLILRWGMEAALLRHSYHPVRDWLSKLPAWDGADRIDNLLQLCLGASVSGDDDDYTLVRTASRDIIMGMTCRAMEPGCAWPRITVLWGDQGCGKSTFYEHLPPSEMDWYFESLHFPMSDEELFDGTRTKWLVEFSDPSTKRAEAEQAKGFLSRKQYQIRHKYGLLSSKHEYGFHMAMSGNVDGNTSIPADASGYRRYLSVDCVKVTDYEGLTAFLDEHRQQIFAEAMYRYHAGERFEELPDALHEARDSAAQQKAGNGSLDNFFESVAAQVASLQAGDRFPEGGVSVHELVTRFMTVLNTSTEGPIFKEPDQARVSEFVNRNSVPISAGLKQLGLSQRKIGKAKLRRWFPSV